MKARIIYNFDSLAELKTINNKIDKLKEVDTSLGSGMVTEGNQMMDFFKQYTTQFNQKYFSLNPTQEALVNAQKLSEDSLGFEENPFAGAITFKSRFIFPYKIKKIDNTNAKISPDSMGIEINCDILEVRKNPAYFKMNIEFK